MEPTANTLHQRILEHAAAAPSDPARWGMLVDDVKALFSARGAALFTPEPAGNVQPLGITCADLVDCTQDYFANWAHDDAWLKAVEGGEVFRQAGEARFSQEFLADTALRKTAFFADWCRTYETEQSLALKITDGTDPDAPVMHLSMFRRLTDPPFTARDRTRLQLLWPALQSATRARWALRSVPPEAHAVEQTLDALPTPTWIVREDARVDFCNAAARELLRQRVWAREYAGVLQSIGHWGAAALRSHIEQGVRTGPCRSVVSVQVKERTLRGRLSVVPISATALYASQWPHARALLMLDLPAATDRDAQWRGRLAGEFQLTPMEALILEDLGQGASVADIATARGIKVTTVRTHLHHLLEKTGRAGQGELVRLALGV